MTSYLITGGGRGIGLELTRQLAALASSSLIITTTRSSQPTEALAAAISAAPQGKIVHITCDVNDNASVSAATEVVGTKLGGAGLDVLINNVGAVGDYSPGGMVSLKPESLSTIFETNVVTAHRVTSGFLDLLRRGKAKKVINLSTSMGSLALAPRYAGSGIPAYFVTKTALSMLTVQYAPDYAKEGFTIFALAPSWLKTDLGSQRADLEVESGVKACLEVILNRSGPKANGKFLNVHISGWEDSFPSNYDGKDIPG